jgi:hypothetical protein
MIVSFIISSSHSNPDGISLVDGKIEDQLPDAPKWNWDDGKENSSEHVSSSASGIFGEEVDHLTGSDGAWNQKEEGNENKPPWKVFVQ